MPEVSYGWDSLPADAKEHIFSFIPLDHMLNSVQYVFREAPKCIDDRIRALQPLWRAWVNSSMEMRNPPQYRNQSSRARCLPAEFVTLERLVLTSSGLSGAVSAAVAELSESLKVLHMDDNLLHSLPSELCRCKRLLLLDCNNNQFQEIPELITSMSSLRYIFFSQNPNLDTLPDAIGRMPHLITISVEKCSLQALPVSLILRIASKKDFYASITENNFPKGYIRRLCDKYGLFSRNLSNSLSNVALFI